MVNFAISDLRAGVQEMVGAIVKICEVASIPFKKTKASDELKYIPLLPEFLNCFKYFFTIINKAFALQSN